MKTRTHPCVLSVLLVTLAPLIGFPSSPEEAAVLRVTEEWQRAWDNNDFEKLEQLLTDEIYMESRSLRATFKDKMSFLQPVRKMKAQQRAGMYTFVTIVTDAKVKIPGDETSVVRTFYTERTGGGDRPWRGDRTTKEMRLRKQSSGEWKIYYEK